MRTLALLGTLLLLSACGGDGGIRPVAAVSTPEPRTAHHPPISTAGLGSVLGADADALIRQFGTPRLDIREGDARKLQWEGPGCILDAYLYPGEHGARAPVATYVDARRADGRDIDRAACVSALRRP